MGERHVRIEISDFVMRTFVLANSPFSLIIVSELYLPKEVPLMLNCLIVGIGGFVGAVLLAETFAQ